MKFISRSLPAFSLVLFVLAALSISAFGQTFSSSIAGTVTDPSGSVVAGAKVHLRNMGTNDVRDVTTTTTGSYKFDNLLPGTYEVSAEASGFKRYVQSNMILRASTAATVNVPLAVGGSEQSVQVTGEAVLLDTESANNTVTMDSHLIESLPNSYRNPLNFVFALAGTTEAQAGLTSRSGSFDQYGSMVGLNGGRTGDEQVLIDGAPSTAVDWGGLLVAPVNDSVEEQQVVQNVYDAQYERSGAGVITLVTKSGSNSFHGGVYDYLRNSALDANSWANDRQGAAKGLFHRNQFGAYLGGPISRSHHVFFYGAYEGLRQPETDSTLITVPTAAERSGDFSHTFNPDGSLQVVYNPFSTHQVCCDGNGNPYFTRDPFPGNIIPSNLINSVGQNLVNLYPQANRPSDPGPNDNNNFFAQAPGRTDNDKFDWRIDWEQSAKNRIFVRMSDRIRQNNIPACFFCNGADTGSNNKDYGYQLVLNDTYTPSPTWVIDFYAAYGRWWEGQTQVGLGKQNLSTIGLSPSFAPQLNGLPLVHADLYSEQGTDFSTFDRYIRSNVTWIGNVTKQLNRHSLKFGANYDIAFMNLRSDRPLELDFGRSFTSCEPIASGCEAVLSSDSFTTGNAIASMLLGTGGGSSTISMDPAMSLHTIGVYLQDQWRATDKLTITAGLRYENQRPATERYNRLTYFDPKAINPISTAVGYTTFGQFEYASKNNRYAWGPDNLNFAPRLGIAYKVTDKLVARVGAGLFYSPASAMVSFDSPGEFLGFSSTTNWLGSQNNQGFIPTNLVSNPFPNGLVQPVGSALGGLTQVGDGAGQIWPAGPHSIGYSEQWSADLQYQLGSHSVAEIGYSGTRGRHLMFGNPDLNADQLPTQYLSMGSALFDNVPNPFFGIADPNTPLGSAQTVFRNQLLRPYPEFTFLNYARSLPGATSAYDALTAKYTKQFSGGLSMISSYVWSKALDDGSEDLIGWAIGGLWRDSYNPKLDYGISMHDVPQSFATAFVYDLPYGHGKHWGGATPGVVNQILGNWQLSGTVRLTSGLPLLSPFYSDNPLADNFGFPGLRFPNLVGDPKPSHQTAANWINGDAFAQPGDFSLGDMPSRTTELREGATKNVDLSVAKAVDLTERFKAQFRAEFLNVFNHPVYGGTYYGGWGSNIALCIDCGDLGTVYGTRNDPRNIQLSLKLMF
ncbi:MAG TPA: TonB-dependent receptor [Terriglobales bacterium]|nr:TonB-dependent receptor [Terriglobales bacterium]